MSTKTRFKKTETKTPTTMGEADIVVREIGNLQSQINEIEADAKAKMAVIKKTTDEKLKELFNNQDNAVTALFTYATKNRHLLATDSKTIKCLGGAFGWRNNTPAVDLSLLEAEVIEILKKSRRKRFVRLTPSLDKNKMLQDRPVVEGVRYVQTEEFFVKPKNISSPTKTMTRVTDT